jgi:hypothetical protein
MASKEAAWDAKAEKPRPLGEVLGHIPQKLSARIGDWKYSEGGKRTGSRERHTQIPRRPRRSIDRSTNHWTGWWRIDHNSAPCSRSLLRSSRPDPGYTSIHQERCRAPGRRGSSRPQCVELCSWRPDTGIRRSMPDITGAIISTSLESEVEACWIRTSFQQLRW